MEVERKTFREMNLRTAQFVKVNVGGSRFTTSLATLTACPDSMLSAMFSGRHELVKDEKGCYFIDRDPTFFRHILNWLREYPKGNVPDLPPHELDQLAKEAAFYGLEGFPINKKKIHEGRHLILQLSMGNSGVDQIDRERPLVEPMVCLRYFRKGVTILMVVLYTPSICGLSQAYNFHWDSSPMCSGFPNGRTFRWDSLSKVVPNPSKVPSEKYKCGVRA